jgi:broad specificity phosphatase PhoE
MRKANLARVPRTPSSLMASSLHAIAPLRLLVMLLCVLLLAPPAGAGSLHAQELTVILVRHAERADDSRDAALSDAGLRRAALLADVLADAGVDAIYTTQFQRTINTAGPLAARLGVKPVAVESAGSSHAEDVARRVREHRSGTVLVVGHSNTVPAILEALGGPAVAVGDDEFSHLFIFRMTPAGNRLIRARF